MENKSFIIKNVHPHLNGKEFNPSKGTELLVIFKEHDYSKYPKIIAAFQCYDETGIDNALNDNYPKSKHYVVYSIYTLQDIAQEIS